MSPIGFQRGRADNDEPGMALNASGLHWDYTGETMTDRELLEAAARAAGITLKWSAVEGQSPRDESDWSTWNPLEDDAAALRLAVKLQLCAFPCDGVTLVELPGDLPDVYEECTAETRLEAVRRAIVRAAAAMSKENTLSR